MFAGGACALLAAFELVVEELEDVAAVAIAPLPTVAAATAATVTSFDLMFLISLLRGLDWEEGQIVPGGCESAARAK
jgi:hypothetical protein